MSYENALACAIISSVWEGRMDRVAHIIGVKLRNKTKKLKKGNKMQNETDNLGCLLVALTTMPSAKQSPMIYQKPRVPPSSAGFNASSQAVALEPLMLNVPRNQTQPNRVMFQLKRRIIHRKVKEVMTETIKT